MLRTSDLRGVPARGEYEPICPRVDGFRTAIIRYLPFDSTETIRDRSGIPARCCHAQKRGEHPLTVKYALEATNLFLDHENTRRVWDELLSPLGLAVISRPGAVAAMAVLSATGRLMGAVAQVEESVGAALEDSEITTDEQIDMLRTIHEARARLDQLERRVRGVA